MRYSIKNCKKLLYQTLKSYKKKIRKFKAQEKSKIEESISSLEKAILKKDKKNLKPLAKGLEKINDRFFKKNIFQRTFEGIITLFIALFIAFLIRQTCFENYTIPSGSMRPTLKEKDFLIVSKTSFGINNPLSGHIYFNEKLLKRGDIVTFTTANMDIPKSYYM